MHYFKYIFYLGIVYVVFSIIWFFLAKLPKLIFSGGREESLWESHIFKIIQYYFIASLTLLKAQEYIISKSATTLNNSFYFFLIGGIVLYLYLYGKYERTKQFSGIKTAFSILKKGEVKSLNIQEKTKYEPHIIGITIIFYIVSLKFPVMVNHGVNYWLLESINDFYNTIIIGWVLGIVGFVFLLGMILKGISATGEMVQILVGLITGKPYKKKEKKNPFDKFGGFNQGQNPFGPPPNKGNQTAQDDVDLDDDDFVDFEIIEDDEDEKE